MHEEPLKFHGCYADNHHKGMFGEHAPSGQLKGSGYTPRTCQDMCQSHMFFAIENGKCRLQPQPLTLAMNLIMTQALTPSSNPNLCYKETDKILKAA